MWQDVIFLAGSVFSLVVLFPTLRNPVATVPLGTSLPSSLIGMVYGATFLTLDMTLSAAGALLTGVLWSVIATLRSPRGGETSRGADPAPVAEGPSAD